MVSRTVIVMMVCIGLAACAGPAPVPDASTGADKGRSSHSSGVAYRDTPVLAIKAAPARVSIKGDPRLGSAAARIGIVGFSDYQCLHCEIFHRGQFAQIRKEYVDTGVAQFIHKDLPLRIHAHAISAAMAAHCADAQGRFWDMHDALFAHQVRLGQSLYAELARQLGLDTAKFSDCLENRIPGDGIARDAGIARKFGFNGTPSFLIGIIEGDMLIVKHQSRGAPDFGVFAQEIEKLR